MYGSFPGYLAYYAGHVYLRWIRMSSLFVVATATMQHLTPSNVMIGKLLSTVEVTLTSEALKLELSSPRFYHSRDASFARFARAKQLLSFEKGRLVQQGEVRHQFLLTAAATGLQATKATTTAAASTTASEAVVGLSATVHFLSMIINGHFIRKGLVAR